MKNYLQVEKDRKKYHAQPSKNTIHRSSLTAPNISKSDTWISFINHFLLKRNYKSIALKLSAIDKFGNLLDSQTIQITEPVAYSLNLNKIFLNLPTNNYLIDFYSNKNLFIPFPAVVVSHIGKDFCNTVHSFNRILNDVFEDDKINKNHVSEASFDIKIDKTYDTFFNLNTGISNINNENIFISYTKNNYKFKKKIKVSLPRLSYKSFFFSKILPKNLDGGIVKVKQPLQKLFYGRMLAGRINKKTGAFSANHSYYDSSKTKEYFPSSKSSRTYPYFEKFLNQITVYPIFSPSKLDFYLKIHTKNSAYISPSFKFSSSSKSELNIIVNDFVNSNKIKNVTAFSFIANSGKGKIPTRVNHQLIYSNINKTNSLKCSINLSLTNKSVFMPKHKTSFIWGQTLNHKDYNSKLGICFKNSEGLAEKIKINFYNEKGKVKTINKKLLPYEALILDTNKLFGSSKNLKFYWYNAECKRPDLSAYSFHMNKISGNSSGEHNF